MQQLETKGITDRWIKASWEEYLAAINHLPENQGKSYYYIIIGGGITGSALSYELANLGSRVL
ncbi:MAG: hypothetical protein O9317_00400, partial [Microcystis sp. LE19-59.1C]|nr:hypothetical protein [Microcystis sp. LE19-59.1C]